MKSVSRLSCDRANIRRQWWLKLFCISIISTSQVGCSFEASVPPSQGAIPGSQAVNGDPSQETFHELDIVAEQAKEGGLGHPFEGCFSNVSWLDSRPLLSAYGHFNVALPRGRTSTPGEVSIESSHDGGLRSLLPPGFPEFSVLENGVLRRGLSDDTHPLGVFQMPDGTCLAAYLHNNYEFGDGEGVSIEISGLFLDSAGGLLGAEQELSSWYEYEGSIRIRNLVHADGCLATDEQIFEPVDRDRSGRPASYMARDKPMIVEVLDMCFR